MVRLLRLLLGLLVSGVAWLSVLGGTTTLVHGDKLIVHMRSHVHHVGCRLVGSPSLAHHVRRIHHGSALLGNTLVEHGSTLRRIELRLRETHLAAGSILGLKLSTALLLALSEGNVKRLAFKHESVHFGNGLGGFLGGGEANKTKTLALTGTILLDVAAGDGTKLGEFLAKAVFVNFVTQVLDVQVHTSVLFLSFETLFLELLTKFFLTLRLFLGTSNEESASANFGAVEGIDGSAGGIGGLEVDETEASGFTLSILGDSAAGNGTEGGEHRVERFIVDVSGEVLDIDVGEFALSNTSTILLGLEGGDRDSLIGDALAVNTVDSLEGGLVTLVVDETVS
jgi:hypothetical protein